MSTHGFGKHTKAYLHFSDGTTFSGKINLDASDARLKEGIWGEGAFTTSMAGYQETLTDPSYLGQHVIFAYPHVGNYPADPKRNQSTKVHATAAIAREFTPNEFFDQNDIPLFYGLDTRALVKYMTSVDDHRSIISLDSKPPAMEAFLRAPLHMSDLKRVSQTEMQILRPGPHPIVVMNYGIKQAILNFLLELGAPLVTLPYNASKNEIMALAPSMVFLSNGPGDPRDYKDQIEVIKEVLTTDVPLRGICLGHQLLSLALGADVVKLPFGQRGSNHPIQNHLTGEVQITSQNHGYATSQDSFKKIADNNKAGLSLLVESSSLFDTSLEGMVSKDLRLRSVQYHPEANPGPLDSLGFFKEIGEFLKGDKMPIPSDWEPLKDLKSKPYTKDIPYKKLLIVGSGPIKIGQASEFDYSGTQACRALKAKGFEVVLVNSNPATIMTDLDQAYKTYIEPITLDTVKAIIEKENIDAVISTMGGQTALNLCIELEKSGWLEAKGVKLLGAGSWTIERTENRDLFAEELAQLGYKAGDRIKAQSLQHALELARDEVKYPILIRKDFALGGQGAALVQDENELKELLMSESVFPVTLERSLHGFKELELEVMVDKDQNGVVICSIENIDPCGVHTGDSITVAPAQTISDKCLQQLRTMSLTIAKRMGVVAGGANVQFAINPLDEDDIVVIEMNPRVSRSSALASKATGYPIAKISALLAVGYNLKEILNDITKASPVAFEPSLDYVAVKVPVFPFQKFPSSSRLLGPQMRSVGEVLALGSTFNEAFLKALRSLETGLEIPTLRHLRHTPIDFTEEYIRERLTKYYDFGLISVLEAVRFGIPKNEIYSLSKVSPWFIEQMEIIFQREEDLKALSKDFTGKVEDHPLFESEDYFRDLKKLGLSDKHIARLTNLSEKALLEYRIKKNIRPVYKSVDTCSGEFTAKTPYFYSTYDTINEALPYRENKEKSLMILASGPNRIGQGIEFDYSCVKACLSAKENGYRAIMLNSNPETVSTDYDSSDRLYLTPLYIEDILDIYLNEQSEGVVACFAGQTGIKVREASERTFRNDLAKVPFLGVDFSTLELAEDRKLFDEVLEKVQVSKTKTKEVRGYKNLVNAMIEIGFPIIIRPSFVIGGESMYIFNSHDDMEQLPPQLKRELEDSSATFLVESCLDAAHEYDVDLIRDTKGNTVITICEHIEYAGVHSGDSGMISPPVRITPHVQENLIKISNEMAGILNIVGPVNFQFAVKDEDIYCIEANPRGSRTIPFLSKAFNLNLPSLAIQAMLGKEIPNNHSVKVPHFCVKQSTFPFDRFLKDDIILGPKMRSTGETLGVDYDKHSAILKSYQGNYPSLGKPGKILFSLSNQSKAIILPYLKQLVDMDFTFAATPGTAEYIRRQGLPCEVVQKLESKAEDLIQCIGDKKTQIVFNTPSNQYSSKSDGEIIRNAAIQNGVPCFTREENILTVLDALTAVRNKPLKPLAMQELFL